MVRVDDVIISVAYFSIPIQIVVALIQNPRMRSMSWPIVILLFLFALFILFCGAGHLLRSLRINHGPIFDAINVATSFISLATALYLVPLVPHLFDVLDKALVTEQESNRTLMAFMSFLCHEIRNPLFAITSTLTFMGDDESLVMSEEQCDSLECIEQSTNLMLRLVNDVLDISQLESGKLQLEHRRFDLIKIMEGAASSIRGAIAKQRSGDVTFSTYVSPNVPRLAIGDPVRLLQMAYNLLSNSSKFTRKGFVKFSLDTITVATALENKLIAPNSDGTIGPGYIDFPFTRTDATISGGHKTDQVRIFDSATPRTITVSSPAIIEAEREWAGDSPTLDHDDNDHQFSTNFIQLERRREEETPVEQRPLFQGIMNRAKNRRRNPSSSSSAGPRSFANGSASGSSTSSDYEGAGNSSSTIVLKIEVSDSGVGISPERQRHIFKPYSQAKVSDYREHGGTGLGLSIVTRLVGIMGGTIHVKSCLQEGSVFTVYIPLTVVVSSKASASTSTVSNSSDQHAKRATFEGRDLILGQEDKNRVAHDPAGGGVSLGDGVVLDASSRIIDDIHDNKMQDQGIARRTPATWSERKPQAKRLTTTSAAELSAFSSSSLRIPPDFKSSGCTLSYATSKKNLHLREFNFASNENVVLVVDDNAINRKLLGKMLEKFKLECRFCTNGQEAVDFMKQSRNYSPGHMDRPMVGLLLMDWSMPVMDGCEATRRIRKELQLPFDVPIVALTACAMEEGLEEFLKAGANEIATKPILRDDLHKMCARYLLSVPSFEEEQQGRDTPPLALNELV